ncbi:CobW family GTP-binding protein [Halomonas binhaiensis]|uniref:GTP-binding protein n=1 Tax=Halomonas binhaiensis TaxID=2562282 RepID=A0A5C1NGR9_9GAMM|nr:GTP-binding protein [Halomonas binhaiensis]QEM81638.1 GTP-binding protein [Halomonas binhaiensis]
MAPHSRIPTHVITGFLGSGKSSLIRELIAQKPEGERWAILVNEFGQVGIDQAMFEDKPEQGRYEGEVHVEAMAGGCLCCQLSIVLRATLIRLVTRYRPDRLIIEPSGLGHPSGLVEVLQDEHFSEVLELNDILALLDPRRLDDPRSRDHETFRDQLALADALVITMGDLATEEQRQYVDEWVARRWPAPRWVAWAEHGRLPISRLLEGAGRHDEGHSQALPQPTSHRMAAAVETAPPMVFMEEAAPAPGKGISSHGSALGYITLGLRWHPSERFDLDRLSLYLSALPGECRIKAVMHTDIGWRLYNRGTGPSTLAASSWRRDSRLEIIWPQETHLDPEEVTAGIEAQRLGRA